MEYKIELPPSFWASVNKTESCWLWSRAITKQGYGTYTWNGKQRQVHRISYEAYLGSIPPKLVVDHICYVGHCVNPQHLQLVTIKQNTENRRGATKRSQTGVRGVYLDNKRGGYRATVVHNRKQYNVGRFFDIGEAEAAVIAKRRELFTNNLQDMNK